MRPVVRAAVHLLAVAVPAAVIATLALTQVGDTSSNKHINSGWWLTAVVLVIPVFLAARAGWTSAVLAFVIAIAVGTQCLVMLIYMWRDIRNPLAGMAIIIVMGLAAAYIIAALLGLVLRRKAGAGPVAD